VLAVELKVVIKAPTKPKVLPSANVKVANVAGSVIETLL